MNHIRQVYHLLSNYILNGRRPFRVRLVCHMTDRKSLLSDSESQQASTQELIERYRTTGPSKSLHTDSCYLFANFFIDLEGMGCQIKKVISSGEEKLDYPGVRCLWVVVRAKAKNTYPAFVSFLMERAG